MAEIVHALCAATSIFCAVLLFRGYRTARSRFLLLAVVCFVGLATNSILLFVDLVVLPDIDLRLIRTIAAFVSILGFLVGLIWESQ